MSILYIYISLSLYPSLNFFLTLQPPRFLLYICQCLDNCVRFVKLVINNVNWAFNSYLILIVPVWGENTHVISFAPFYHPPLRPTMPVSQAVWQFFWILTRRTLSVSWGVGLMGCASTETLCIHESHANAMSKLPSFHLFHELSPLNFGSEVHVRA